jgi:hypothetical protein
MAAAVDATEGQKALEAKIREVEKELKGATGDKEVALQQRLTALEQQKLLLMQHQSAAAAAAAGARGSDDASAKGPGGSPKQTSTTVTTVALADKSVTLASRFPGIKLCREPAGPSLQAHALEAVTKALLEPALKIMSLSQLRTEAARVHVAGSMLLQALILFPSLDTNHTSLTMSCGDSLADQVSIAEQANKPAELELGFEQHFRAGSFKGRVELQVVYKTQRGIQLFAGAVEVKQEGDLAAHIEQAKKEAFAMWCHNALRQSYGPVWVVLTDLTKVLRVTYHGDNYPGGPGQAYKQAMPCTDVQGTVWYTDDYPFILRAGHEPVASLTWASAVQCFVGGLLGQGTVSEEELQQRVDQHNEKIRQQVQRQLDQLPPPKRAKCTPTH